MQMVVDASVVIACVTGEPERDMLLAAVAGHTLVSPASLPWEIGNALSAGFKRGRFTLEQAAAAIDLFGRIAIRLQPVELELAIRLAHAARMYAYDAYMLQCALDSGGPLLTLDRGLIAAARGLGIPIVEVKS